MADPVDVLIIGGGPGGLTTALTLVRQLQSCIVFDSGKYRNAMARDMHMVMTWDGKDPEQFREAARQELLAHYETARIEKVEITSVSKTTAGQFVATDANGKTWTGKKLVLATGVEDIFPEIEGYAECWGTGM
jgi:gliotoxin/aspirochlorine biosynthesis thioredoxin reductase